MASLLQQNQYFLLHHNYQYW